MNTNRLECAVEKAKNHMRLQDTTIKILKVGLRSIVDCGVHHIQCKPAKCCPACPIMQAQVTLSAVPK